MRTLLVLSDCFPQEGTNRYRCSFVKDYVDLVKDDFEKIYIIIGQPYFPKFFTYFSFFKKYGNYSNFIDYNYNNVEIKYINFFTLPFLFFRKINGDLLFNKISKLIIKEKINFDIIHSHFLYTSGYIGFKIKEQNLKSKFIITVHEGDIDNVINKNNYLINKIEKSILGSDAIISVSEYTKLVIDNFFGNVVSIKNNVIHNFVNINKFNVKDKNSLRKQYNFKEDDKIILNVANIVFDKKGQLDLLDIFEAIILQYPDTKLIFIGGGEDENELIRIISNHKEKNNIFYLGSKNKDEIIDYYNIADIFAFPSRYESFGIVQIEALACGCPVIAYKNGGSEYIMKDNKLGILLDRQDKELLKEGIIDMLGKNYDKEYLHNYVKSNFSGEIIKEKLSNLYFN